MGVASSRQSDTPKAHASVQTETPIAEPGNASEALTVIVASTASNDIPATKETIVLGEEETDTMEIDQPVVAKPSLMQNGLVKIPLGYQSSEGTVRESNTNPRQDPVRFEPEHPFAVFELFREIHHHTNCASPLQSFFPAEEYVKLFEMGWVKERHFDWPDAIATLGRGRATLASRDCPPYTLPSLPRPSTRTRIMLRVRYGEDICHAATRERAKARAEAFGQSYTISARQDFRRGWGAVVDSVLRSIGVWEKRHAMSMDMEELIRLALLPEPKDRKREREDGCDEANYGTTQDDEPAPTTVSSSSNFTRVNIEPGEGPAPAKVRKVENPSNPPGFAHASSQTRRRKSCLKTPVLSSGSNVACVQKRKGKDVVKVRFAEPVVPYDPSVSLAGRGAKRVLDEGSEECVKRHKASSSDETRHAAFVRAASKYGQYLTVPVTPRRSRSRSPASSFAAPVTPPPPPPSQAKTDTKLTIPSRSTPPPPVASHESRVFKPLPRRALPRAPSPAPPRAVPASAVTPVSTPATASAPESAPAAGPSRRPPTCEFTFRVYPPGSSTPLPIPTWDTSRRLFRFASPQ